MSEWKVYKLEDIVSFSQGFQISTDQQYEVKEKDMDRFIRIVDYTNKDEKPRYIKKIDKRYWAYKDDVVMIRYGSNTAGKVVRGLSGYIANNMFKVNIIDNNILDKEFLYYFLSQERIYKYLKNSQSSSTMPAIKFSDLYKIDAYLPIIEQQRKVATFLNFINEKTQLNTQTNQTLEAIAQAIFKSWFVDFDPVRAKAQALSEGKSEREANLSAMAVISGKTIEDLSQTEYQELWEIADAFPSELVANEEFGEVPKGWGVKSLDEVCSVISKGTTPRKIDLENAKSTNIVPFIKVRDLNSFGILFDTDFEKIPNDVNNGVLKRSILKSGDILFSIAGTIGRVAIVPEFLNNSNINQALAFLRVNNDSLKEYIYLFLLSPETQEIINSKIVQGVQANISLATLKELKMILPDNIRLLSLLTALINKVEISKKENIKLAKTRDLLLPKLLSGEIEL